MRPPGASKPDPMAGSKEIHQIIESAVNEVFDAQVAKLRSKVIEKVLSDLEPVISGPPTGTPTDQLNSAVASLHDNTSQGEILGALLDGAARFAGRAALFVVRGGEAKGWQARGFEDDGAIKNVTLSTNKGLIGRANDDRMPVAAAAEEFDNKFNQEFGNPSDGNALVLPLVVRDKVAAFVYADAGMEEHAKIDASALTLLVRDAGLWLELLTLRKAGGAPAAASADAEPAPPPAAAPEPPPPPPKAKAAAAAAPAEEKVQIAAGDEEIHKKAKRFAKLLVDEIKLYNQAKVQEGRQNRDLYDRLKEDIEKSRATYEKRYGSTPAASGDYFMAEVVRVLADNDRELMGESFPQ